MMTRWFEIDPNYATIEDIRRRMELLFDEHDASTPTPRTLANWPRANLSDEGEKLVLKAEIPGLDEKSVQVETCQDVLTLSGERKTAVPQGYSVHRQERADLRFSRSFTFPVKVDFEKTTAEVKNGILTVNLPKAPEVKPRSITVHPA